LKGLPYSFLFKTEKFIFSKFFFFFFFFSAWLGTHTRSHMTSSPPLFDLRGQPVRINVLEREWFEPRGRGEASLAALPGVDPEVMSKKAVINSPGHVHSVEQARADHRYLCGDYEGALAGYRQCLARARGEDEEAAAAATKRKSKRGNVQHEIVLCECVARCLLRLQRPKESLTYLTEALIAMATGPVQVELNCLMARCLLASQEFSGAAARAKLSLSARPLSREAWEALAGAMEGLARPGAAHFCRDTLQRTWGSASEANPAASAPPIEDEESPWFKSIETKLISAASRKEEELDPTRLEG
jgi:hypothetical protein